MKNDIWAYLKESEKPIFIYGMGDGGDKMLSAMAAFDIKCSGFFASDGFVRGQLFHGERVMSFSEVREKYDGDFIALMAFGSRRPEVLEYVSEIASKCEFYIPELPVTGDILFTSSFYEVNKSKHDKARALLCDDLSREVFDASIEYRLNGKLSYLTSDIMSTPETEALSLIGAINSKVYYDLGAYTGDTVKALLKLQRESEGVKLTHVTAVEPEKHSHKKLSEYFDSLVDSPTKFRAIRACMSDKDGQTEFLGGRGRGSRVKSGGEVIDSVTVDSLADSGNVVDYIKYDVEGMEKAAIMGSANTISKYAPALNVALYHRPEDIFELPLLIHKLCPSYKLYMRRHGGIPLWDLNLYAVK